MGESIKYHVLVDSGTGAEPEFEMRDPRALGEGDLFQWQGRSYRVRSVRFDPARPRLAVIRAERIAR